MKAELTQENRLRFESLYVGQDVFRSSKEPDESGILTPRLLARPNSKYDWLSLKPLSKISDEDAIEVARILGCIKPAYNKYLNYFLITDDDDQPYPLGRSGFTFKLWFSDCSLELVVNGRLGQISNSLHAFDYLRSRGYALPWMGLSIDELVAAGWIRLV